MHTHTYTLTHAHQHTHTYTPLPPPSFSHFPLSLLHATFLSLTPPLPTTTPRHTVSFADRSTSLERKGENAHPHLKRAKSQIWSPHLALEYVPNRSIAVIKNCLVRIKFIHHIKSINRYTSNLLSTSNSLIVHLKLINCIESMYRGHQIYQPITPRRFRRRRPHNLAKEALLDRRFRPHRCTGYQPLSTRWTTNITLHQMSAGNMSIFAPRKALKLIMPGKLTANERSIVHHVVILAQLTLLTRTPCPETRNLAKKAVGNRHFRSHCRTGNALNPKPWILNP